MNAPSVVGIMCGLQKGGGGGQIGEMKKPKLNLMEDLLLWGKIAGQIFL